jgi:hypothetical protein
LLPWGHDSTVVANDRAGPPWPFATITGLIYYNLQEICEHCFSRGGLGRVPSNFRQRVINLPSLASLRETAAWSCRSAKCLHSAGRERANRGMPASRPTGGKPIPLMQISPAKDCCRASTMGHEAPAGIMLGVVRVTRFNSQHFARFRGYGALSASERFPTEVQAGSSWRIADTIQSHPSRLRCTIKARGPGCEDFPAELPRPSKGHSTRRYFCRLWCTRI